MTLTIFNKKLRLITAKNKFILGDLVAKRDERRT